MSTIDELNSLKPVQVEAIRRMFTSFGTGPDGIRRAAQTFHITEAAAESLATAMTTKPRAASTRVVTESADVHGSAAALGDTDARNRYLAGKLAAGVEQAESKIAEAQAHPEAYPNGPMSSLSTQDLEALAAARFG